MSFKILLPHRSGSRPQPVSDYELPHAITVLAVEDDPLIRMDIAEQLRDLGFKVIEAANASKAMDMLADNPNIQAMFTDVDMPGGMDGLKLAAVVRNRWPLIKIIVTSGHRKVAMTELPDKSRFFTKPYAGDAVASAIREMVG